MKGERDQLHELLDDDVDLWTQPVLGRIDAIARPFASPATRDLIQSRRIKKWDEWSTMNELLQQTDLPSTERACCATALAEYSRRSGETRRIIRNTLDEATKDDAEDVRVAAAAAWKAIEPLPVKPSSRRSKKQ